MHMGITVCIQGFPNDHSIHMGIVQSLIGGGTDKNVIVLNGPKTDSELSNMLSYLTIRCLECFVEKNDHNLTVGCLKD